MSVGMPKAKKTWCRMLGKPTECAVSETKSGNIIGVLCEVCAKYCRSKMS